MGSPIFQASYAESTSPPHVHQHPWEISTPPGSMPVFLCVDAAGRLAIAANKLHNKINEMQNNEHKSIVADMLSDWMADMLSYWKGYWPDIIKQPGENTAIP